MKCTDMQDLFTPSAIVWTGICYPLMKFTFPTPPSMMLRVAKCCFRVWGGTGIRGWAASTSWIGAAPGRDPSPSSAPSNVPVGKTAAGIRGAAGAVFACLLPAQEQRTKRAPERYWGVSLRSRALFLASESALPAVCSEVPQVISDLPVNLSRHLIRTRFGI